MGRKVRVVVTYEVETQKSWPRDPHMLVGKDRNLKRFVQAVDIFCEGQPFAVERIKPVAVDFDETASASKGIFF
jgi:hypothetical protein